MIVTTGDAIIPRLSDTAHHFGVRRAFSGGILLGQISPSTFSERMSREALSASFSEKRMPLYTGSRNREKPFDDLRTHTFDFSGNVRARVLQSHVPEPCRGNEQNSHLGFHSILLSTFIAAVSAPVSYMVEVELPLQAALPGHLEPSDIEPTCIINDHDLENKVFLR